MTQGNPATPNDPTSQSGSVVDDVSMPSEPPDLSDPVSLVWGTVTDWARAFLEALPSILVALVVLLAFVLLARVARRGVKRLMSTVSDNKQVQGLMSSVAYIGVLAIGVFLALGLVNLTGVVTSLLAGVGIIGLALGFAFQDLAANFMAGILMAFRRPFRVGEIIETNDYNGVVESVTLRSTQLRSFQGNEVQIPNKDVFESPIVNYSESGDRRIDLVCGVAYGDDLEHARDVAIASLEGMEGLVDGKPVEMVYTGFGSSSIDFELRFWITFHGQRDFVTARSEAMMRLKRAFDDNGITIPFPITTLDFGVVGGEPLRDAVPEAWFSRREQG